MAQDKVQLKREELVGDQVALQDINPITNTASIIDSTQGLPLDQKLSLRMNMINNKLTRIVNSVNGRTGVVVLDASDVGLDNVDNVSFGDIKDWVIEYMNQVFGEKRFIIKEYLSEIHTIIGTNDQSYADVPFYTEKGNPSGDYTAYIGYMYWDDETNSLKETHRPIRVVGFTDKSLVYNVNAETSSNDNYRNFAHGGLGVNIWSKEDALKIRNNIAKDTSEHRDFTPEELNDSGLYIDKSKIVPDVYFFNGIYGDLVKVDDVVTHNENALVYWSIDNTIPDDAVEITIQIEGTEISYYSTSSKGNIQPPKLYTLQKMKIGDIILTNFSYDEYINPNDDFGRANIVYPKMLDSLIDRQPSFGVVVQVPLEDDDTINKYIVNFYQSKPNVDSGLKLNNNNRKITLDLLSIQPRMNDGTSIYTYPLGSSGLNKFSKTKTDTDLELFTIYPTGKSANIIPSGHIENNSTFILPNYSMCVIPALPFVEHNKLGVFPLSNWNASSPVIDDGTHLIEQKTGLGNSWNMLGVNLTKVTFDRWGEHTDENTHRYARNISGLRINTDEDFLKESWFGFGPDSDNHFILLTSEPDDFDPTKYYKKDEEDDEYVHGKPGETFDSTDWYEKTDILYKHQTGGLSVNVGDFLGIGTQEELINHEPSTIKKYYEEGKVNVRIDTSKGLKNVGDNRLGINIADYTSYTPGTIFDETTRGGLRFNAGGYLAVKINNKIGNDDNLSIGTKGLHIYDNNVLGIQLAENGGLSIDNDGCLRVDGDSPTPGGGTTKEPLTINAPSSTSEPITVSYDGGENIIINFGPGFVVTMQSDDDSMESDSE